MSSVNFLKHIKIWGILFLVKIWKICYNTENILELLMIVKAENKIFENVQELIKLRKFFWKSFKVLQNYLKICKIKKWKFSKLRENYLNRENLWGREVCTGPSLGSKGSLSVTESDLLARFKRIFLCFEDHEELPEFFCKALKIFF